MLHSDDEAPFDAHIGHEVLEAVFKHHAGLSIIECTFEAGLESHIVLIWENFKAPVQCFLC